DDYEEDERAGVPLWEVDAEHPDDVFTFVRAKYSSMRRGRRGGWGGGGWRTDWPASDNNLSYRLQQLTSLKVNPHPKIIELSDPALLDHPFLYLIEPGAMVLDDAEVAGLRRFLQAGGFMMVDDFWGEAEWRNFYEEMKRVLPDREPVELDVSHPIFSAVIALKEKPQVPSIHNWVANRLTYERYDAKEPHYRAWFDDQGRMMAIACHNTDLGDGWEREGEDPEYFQKFAEPLSYPMAINIIFYAMTH
ncbi:MAG TPA: DUF4159 domain-containing protein, partial [Polyangia bacterium]